LNSIINQSISPNEVIVVNDNSTDKTESIIVDFSNKYSFIKVVHSESKLTSHEPGSKIVNAFYKGFDRINSNWDVIVKLDADVILPENYFEIILREFQTNPKVGIAGGLAFIEKNGILTYEKIGSKEHVRGPFKAYSKECFDKIGGLKKSIGWDTVDELLAKFHGFETKVIPELQVILQKPTGIQYQTIHNQKTGQGFYKMDYGFAISFIASAKSAWNQKSLSSFIFTYWGFLKSNLKSDNKIVTKEEGKFIRNYRWDGILKKLINRT